MRRDICIVVALVLLLRLPFLNQAFQTDDIYYLYGARQAIADPAHPTHARYVFQGDLVDMRGHPHPPLNSWYLGLLVAMFGESREWPLHAGYILFSLIAAISMYLLARRFTRRPLLATLLLLVTPAFVISGTALESDLPFLAFWIAGITAFVYARYALAVAGLALAAVAAYQAVVAAPVLWIWCWGHARRSRRAWAATLTPMLVVAAFQAYERITGGTLPASMLAGYFSAYGLQALANKVKNAQALLGHLGWLVFPALLPLRRQWIAAAGGAAAALLIDPHPLYVAGAAGGAAVLAEALRKRTFLHAWVALFFAAALILFFAGAARYLLPLVPPLAVLVAEEGRTRWLVAGVAAQALLSLGLGWVNYEHWDAYRRFAETLPPGGRTWVNAEWGLRAYMERRGARPVVRGQSFRPGDRIVSSELAFPVPVDAQLVRSRDEAVRPTLPLRLLALGTRSGYATIAFGVRPFDVATGPVDRMYMSEVPLPALPYVRMADPRSAAQLGEGFYGLEAGAWRWTARRAVVFLRPPAGSRPLRVSLHAQSPRTVRLVLDGTPLLTESVPEGGHTLTTAPVRGTELAIEVHPVTRAPGDQRELGIIVSEAGFPEEN